MAKEELPLTPHEEFVAFLQRHSGLSDRDEQCPNHPPLRELTHPELVQVMEEELGRVYSRYWIQQLCGRLGIPRRRKRGPHRQPDERRKARARLRAKKSYERLRNDPEAWQEHLARLRERRRRQRVREAG